MPSAIRKSAIRSVGVCERFFSGIGTVRGLPGVGMFEILEDALGIPEALVIGFDESGTDVLYFHEHADHTKPLFRTKKTISLSVSEQSIGRVLNGLGKPLDGLPEPKGETRPVFRAAPEIMDRAAVTEPLISGIKIVDAALPLGRGQRELIIGDRKLGKSSIALDAVLNQRDQEHPVFCVYVVCGQSSEKVARLIHALRDADALAYTTVISAPAGTSLAEQYLAPFVGCAIAEFFRDAGKDSLIIYDDLSRHAKAYRDISLLLERPPGREAYPGDIFTLHAELLERAAHLSPENGGGSLTALPIIETLEGDITSFIATNLISITDGQIYLERGLFQRGFLPPVNVGLSVSRVGGAAQPSSLRGIVGGLRLALSQHKELQKLSQLETVVSERSRKRIQRGELILELLKQEPRTCVRTEEQVVLFFAVEEGSFDDLDPSEWVRFEQLFLDLLRIRYRDVLQTIRGGTFNEKTKTRLRGIIDDFREEFLTTSYEKVPSA